jgi:hypothetical protein
MSLVDDSLLPQRLLSPAPGTLGIPFSLFMHKLSLKNIEIV